MADPMQELWFAAPSQEGGPTIVKEHEAPRNPWAGLAPAEYANLSRKTITPIEVKNPDAPEIKSYQASPIGSINLEGLLAQQQGPGQLGLGALMSPDVLGETIPMGGSSSSSVQRVIPGPPMPGQEQAMTRLAESQKDAVQASANAQARAQEAIATEQAAHAQMLQARQARFEQTQGERMAEITRYDAEAAKLRADIANDKLDPERYWKNQTTGTKLTFALAAAVSGFVQGFRGQGGPNPVHVMMDVAVDRDIEAQKMAMASKRARLGDVRGVLSDLYARLGDMRQAEDQARIMLGESVKSKLQSISASTQSDIIKSSVAASTVEVDKWLLNAKMQAWEKSHPPKQVSSSSSTQRVPLVELLMKAQQAQQKATQKKMPQQSVVADAANINMARRELAMFAREYKQLGIRPGLTKWYGGKGDAVEAMRKRLVDKIVVSTVPGGGSTEHLKLFEGALGHGFNSDAEVLDRVKMLSHELDAKETAILEANAPYANVMPLAINADKNRRLMEASLKALEKGK